MISIFVNQGAERTSFSSRALVEEGRPNFKAILQDEVTGKHLIRTAGESDKRGRTLVLGKYRAVTDCITTYSISVSKTRGP